MNTTTVENRGQANEIPVQPVPPPSMDKEGYVIESGGVAMNVLWVSEDKTTAVGVWEAQPGVVNGVFLFDENDVIVSGHMTIYPKGGDPIEVRQGDSLFIPNGTEMRWEIHEAVRKQFTMYNPDGLPV